LFNFGDGSAGGSGKTIKITFVIPTEASLDASGRAKWRNPLYFPFKKSEGIPRLPTTIEVARDDRQFTIMITEKIKQELELIRPHLQMDGGDVEFVEFDEATGVLKLRLQGHCVGCPMSQMTLQEGIGRTIKEKVPEVKEVVSI